MRKFTLPAVVIAWMVSLSFTLGFYNSRSRLQRAQIQTLSAQVDELKTGLTNWQLSQFVSVSLLAHFRAFSDAPVYIAGHPRHLVGYSEEQWRSYLERHIEELNHTNPPEFYDAIYSGDPDAFTVRQGTNSVDKDRRGDVAEYITLAGIGEAIGAGLLGNDFSYAEEVVVSWKD